MQNSVLRALAEFIANQPSPVMAVVVIFIVGFLSVGVPAHFRGGPRSRDVWGTVAGASLSVLYMIVLFSAKSGIHN
jgi:hypothetical protein